MTKQEFLKRLGLSSEEFRDLMEKLVHFLERMNEPQRNAVLRSMPTVAQAATAFGPKITPDQLNKILKEILEGIDTIILGCHSIEVINPTPEGDVAANPPDPSNSD